MMSAKRKARKPKEFKRTKEKRSSQAIKA